VEGWGVPHRTIDWLFERSPAVPVLLEVKYRRKDLIRHLAQVAAANTEGTTDTPVPPSDPESLFKDTAEKFLPRTAAEGLQGAWIHSQIKQEESGLELLRRMDSQRLQFAFLVDCTMTPTY
jgi:hypothetical protein